MKGKATTAETAVPRLDAFSVGLRIVSASLFNYLFAYALTAALAGFMYRALHADRVDTAIISTNVALLVGVALAVWIFAERRLWLVAALPLGLAALFSGIAWIYRP
jgi:hypothetical protein